MAQPFSYRYPLVDGQGNWGSTDDPEVVRGHALHRIAPDRVRAACCCRELGQGTVEWQPNFDGTLEEPVLLAGARAQSPAQRHLGHRGRHGDRHSAAQSARGGGGLRAPLDDPEISVRKLCQHIKGPDFPDRRRDHLAAQRAGELLRVGKRQLPCARLVRDRGRRDRHHRAALPGVGHEDAGADRRADAGEEAADGRGHPRRVRPRESRRGW